VITVAHVVVAPVDKVARPFGEELERTWELARAAATAEVHAEAPMRGGYQPLGYVGPELGRPKVAPPVV
jgi:hypothetical protein